jgi:hypothetical protein
MGYKFPDPEADYWLEFNVDGKHAAVREREVAEIGGYHIYVERCWREGLPGTDECAAVCGVEPATNKIAAMRSAVLVANGSLKMTDWDCTEHFCEL